jgi:single-strand DNA-binding protein
MSFNKITIVGYLGRAPELRYTPQGTAVCNMSVATTEKRRNTSGNTEEHTIWFRVTAWGRQAESAAEYLAKGRQVYVEGRLRLEEYTDRDGNLRTSPEVNATDIQFLGQRVESARTAGAGAEENGRSGANGSEDDEIPTTSEAVLNTAGKSSKRGTKRSSNKETAGIEDDGIPF